LTTELEPGRRYARGHHRRRGALDFLARNSPSAAPSILASSRNSTLPKIRVPLLMQDWAVAPVGSIAIESHLSSTLPEICVLPSSFLPSIQPRSGYCPRSGAAVQHMGWRSGKIKRGFVHLLPRLREGAGAGRRRLVE
jgi:hypothetical protein